MEYSKKTTTIILTDPLFNDQEVLSPFDAKFKGSDFQVCRNEINPDLEFSQLAQIISFAKPEHLILPEHYAANPFIVDLK